MSDVENFHIEKFSRSITPLPIEIESQGSSNLMYWGSDNLYPNFLLKVYETVPLHQSIINSKVDYLIGEGMVDKETKKPLDKHISLSESNEQFAQKVTFDYTIFGWIVVGVQYNRFGKPIFVYHVPGNHVRTNRSKSKFWVCEDWGYRQQAVLDYDAFKAGNNPGGRTKYYMYKAYTPSVNNVYPSIAYSSAIINMVTEAILNEFGKNDIEDGFSAAHIISFFKGLPGTEQAAEFDKKFRNAYTGEKGFKVLIDYNNPKTKDSQDNSIKIQTIDSPDYSAKMDSISKKCETNILTAHQATSRILFGIEQSGGLGSGQELENAFQIFKEVWVKNNRNKVEDGLNTLFRAIGFREIEMKDRGTALPKSLSDPTREKVYTINELREQDGSEKVEGGDKFIEQPKAITAGNSFSLVKKEGKILTDEDFELVKHLGTSRTDFDILDDGDFHLHTPEGFRSQELYFDDMSDVETYLMENDITGKSTSEIRAAIKKDLGISVTTKEIETKISRMTEARIIGDKDPPKKLTRDVKVLYQYEVRPGFGKAIIPGTRGFCRKLINNDRYYSREEIQQMSAIFGYDVFKHCGGWYYNPKTKEAENQCRHYFKSVRVIKKQAND